MKSTIAFVFPGQGSQSLGMLSELAERFPHVIEIFDSVSERLGYDLWKLTQQGPEDLLNQTEYTQAAVLTADIAVFTLVQNNLDLKPVLMAGHSLGEYAALVAAGVLSLPDAAVLVSTRGKLMQDAIPYGHGAMAAIVGLPDDKVIELCAEASSELEVVSPANFNAIGQVVIAGHTTAVERALVRAEMVGARMAKIIPVSVPCHCNLLTQMASNFDRHLQNTVFNQPIISVISNVDLSIYESVSQIKSLLKQQLYSPVRWVETIQKMKNMGIDTIVECGPGKVLTGLVKRIDKSIKTFSVNDYSNFEQLELTMSEKEGLF